MNNLNWIIIQSEERGADYGVGSFARHFSFELSKRADCQVTILKIGCNKSPVIKVEEKDGITVINIRQIGKKNGLDSKDNQIKIGRNIARAIQSYIPGARNNVIHINFSYQIFIGHELASLLECKLIFTQHILPKIDNNTKELDGLDVEVFKKADALVSVTKNGRENLICRLAPPNKVVSIYNGIDPFLFKPTKENECIRQKYGIRNDDKIVLYAGRLDGGKGLKFLLEAFSRLLDKLPDCQLVLAGDGNYNEIIEYSRSFSSQISTLGFLPFHDLVQLYQEASLGIIPSLQEECSYVALEMLHSGLPVIASKVGGLREIFTHEKEGLLVDMLPNLNGIYCNQPDVNQLTDKMVQLLTNKELREEMKRLAQVKANSKFTAQRMVDEYISIVTN